MSIQNPVSSRRIRAHPQCKYSFLAALLVFSFGLGFCGQVASAQVTLQIVNNFNPSVANSADYFGTHYDDSEVWLYFLNTGGAVTYINSTTGIEQAVSNATAFKLSEVQSGLFTLGGWFGQHQGLCGAGQ